MRKTAGLCLLSCLAGTDMIVAQETGLEEIVVTTTRGRRSFEEQPTRIEVLGSEEIAEKANMKPGDIRMLLNESTGIHVQQTSATTFNSSIRIQGLDGKYTQLLRDGMPLYSGFSGGLSLLQVAPLDLQQVEVIKGANSTLYGGGAIAGLVNLITRKPGTEPERSFLVNATSANGLDTSGFFAGRTDRTGGSLFASYNRGKAYDPADIGLSAIPEFERWTVNPRLFLYGESSELMAGFTLVTENRLGGDTDYINGNRDVPAWFERSDTTRIATQLQYTRLLESGDELVLRNSLGHFERDLEVPGSLFSGTQSSSFSEAHIVGDTGDMEWVLGANLWTENFNQHDAQPVFSHDFDSHTVGVFAQGTLPVNPQWTVEGGVRVDQTRNYGHFVLPKFSVLYAYSADTTVRFGGGMGYKLPTLFTEDAERVQFRDIQPLATAEFDAEESAGLNLDFTHRMDLGDNLALDLNLLFFHTRVSEPLNLVAQPGGGLAFGQASDHVDTRGLELNAVWQWGNFRYFLGFTQSRVREHRDGQSSEYPLVPRHRVNNVLMYEKEDDMRIGLEAYYYSRQLLTDGSRGRDYWILGLMMEKVLGEKLSLFLNFENFLDTRQTRYGSIYTGSRENPGFVDLYAPLDGFVVNGGFRIRL